MILTPGQRLTRGERTAYELLGAAWETPRHSWLRARKVLWNFRHPGGPLFEADPGEWLDVLVRVPRGPLGADRDGLSFECDKVHAAGLGPWFPELIDLIDAPDGSALAVLSDPHVARPGLAAPVGPAEAAALVRTLTEALGMLDALHRAGLAAVAIDPADFLVDASGRWSYAGTDRVRPSAGASSARDDLAAWASCVEALLGPTGGGTVEGAWASIVNRPGEAGAPARWLFERVRWCSDPDPARRPASVDDLARGRASVRGALGALRRAFGPRRPPHS